MLVGSWHVFSELDIAGACPLCLADACKRAQASIERMVIAGHELPLAALASAVGLNPGHFQREFSACVGLFTKHFSQMIAKERLVKALRADLPVLHAAFEAGLSGPGVPTNC